MVTTTPCRLLLSLAGFKSAAELPLLVSACFITSSGGMVHSNEAVYTTFGTIRWCSRMSLSSLLAVIQTMSHVQGYDLLGAVNSHGCLRDIDLSGTSVHIDMLTEALMPSFAAPHCSEGACGSSTGVTRLALANIGCLYPPTGPLLQSVALDTTHLPKSSKFRAA